MENKSSLLNLKVSKKLEYKLTPGEIDVLNLVLDGKVDNQLKTFQL